MAETDLITQAIGPRGSEFSGVFREAYEQLEQPDEFAKNEPVVASTVNVFAQQFVAEFRRKHGADPTPDQIRNFVGASITPSIARKVITGQFNFGGVVPNIIEPYFDVQDLRNETGLPDETLLGGFREAIEQVYAPGAEQIDRESVGPANLGVSVEGLQGTLRSPIALKRGRPISNVDEMRRRSKSELRGALAQARVGGELSLTDTLARLKEQRAESLRNFGLKQQTLKAGLEQQDLENLQFQQKVNLAKEVARRQANAPKKSLASALLGGTGQAGIYGGMAKGGWQGAGISALGGLLAGISEAT